MPKYDLNSLSNQIILKSKQRKDISILLDGKNYFAEPIDPRFIKNIHYSCPSGSILIESLFDLSKVNIPELLTFKYLNINFSPELILANKQPFDNPEIFINFKLTLDSEQLIRKHINNLKKIFTNFDTDYKSFIKFNLKEFSDVNILEMLNKMEEEDKNKFEFGIKELKQEKKYNININEEEEKEEDDNFFNLITVIKEKEKEINENKEEEQENEIIKKNNYIKVKDIDKLDIENSKIKKINNRLLKKYLQSKKDKEISNNLLLPININNMLFTLETNEENKEMIQIKNVYINDDLKQLNEKYKKDIILDFLDLFIVMLQKNNKKIMSIDDYTFIIISFIKNIEKKISEINTNKLKENEYKYYIYRLEKISISLKLFHILFLNCFYSNEEKDNFINNNDKLYNDFFSLKVQTLRKKKLIEWCMQQQNNYLKKNDFYTINKNKRKEILTKQLMSFGQIKTAINTNKNQNLFINSKISNLNDNISNNTMTYFLKNQRGKNEINKIFISYKENEAFSDKINNSWISFLLQSLLYKEKKNEYIIKSIDLIEQKIKEMDNNSKPLIKGVFHLNFVLLKLYQKIVSGSKDIIENINMLSNNNLFGKNNSDHFCQYIILFLFSKIIGNIIPDLIEENLLYQKNYDLLIQVITEILTGNIIDNNN